MDKEDSGSLFHDSMEYAKTSRSIMADTDDYYYTYNTADLNTTLLAQPGGRVFTSEDLESEGV